jgi:hypothetical protein
LRLSGRQLLYWHNFMRNIVRWGQCQLSYIFALYHSGWVPEVEFSLNNVALRMLKILWDCRRFKNFPNHFFSLSSLSAIKITSTKNSRSSLYWRNFFRFVMKLYEPCVHCHSVDHNKYFLSFITRLIYAIPCLWWSFRMNLSWPIRTNTCEHAQFTELHFLLSRICFYRASKWFRQINLINFQTSSIKSLAVINSEKSVWID